jgi:hypothetical protein
MARVYSFGCSFTKWIWPTWADIVAYDLGLYYENWGLTGIGNVGISHRIFECDLKNNFTPDDLILVLWSSWNREDRFNDGGWSTFGNIFNNNFYDKHFTEKYWSLTNDIIKNSTAMISFKKSFGHVKNFQGNILPVMHFESSHIKITEQEKKVLDFYLGCIEIDDIFPDPPQSKHKIKLNDAHPDVADHLFYVENFVYPRLNKNLRSETKKHFLEMHNFIVDFIENFNDKKMIQENLIIELKKKYQYDNSRHYGW